MGAPKTNTPKNKKKNKKHREGEKGRLKKKKKGHQRPLNRGGYSGRKKERWGKMQERRREKPFRNIRVAIRAKEKKPKKLSGALETHGRKRQTAVRRKGPRGNKKYKKKKGPGTGPARKDTARARA